MADDIAGRRRDADQLRVRAVPHRPNLFMFVYAALPPCVAE